MGCFDDIVGIRGCSDTSLVYVQQLPAVNIADFDQAISTEAKSAYTRIEELIVLACSEAVADIRTALASKYELRSFVENNVVGHWLPDMEIVSAQTGYLTGVRVRIARTPYLLFYLHSIKLFADEDGDVEVKVYDLTQNKLLDTITVSAVAGEVSLALCDKSYYTDKQVLDLFIGYESEFDCYKSQLSTRGTGEDYAHSYISFSNRKILASGAKIADNLQSNNYSSGLSLSYSLQCDFQEVLCNARNLIAPAINYLVGAKIMQEMRYSKRLTSVVRGFTTDHAELQAEFEKQYQTRMNDIVRNMQLPNSECFKCSKSVSIEVALP